MKRILPLVTAIAFAIGSAHANLIIANGNNLSLYTVGGTKIFDYATNLVNPQRVVTDNSGNVFVSEYGPGLPPTINGSIKMYDIASGNFIRSFLPPNLYAPTALAFNPNNPGEIIALAQYNGGQSQLMRLNTSTGTFTFTTQGAPYAGAVYSGGLIYMAAPAGVIQTFDATSLALVNSGVKSLTAPSGVTAIGSEQYYTAIPGPGPTPGAIYTQSGVTPLITGLTNPFGLTTDGTDLWVSDLTLGTISRYNTSGVLQNSFSGVTGAAGIAFTAIPEPSTYALFVIGGIALLIFRRRRAA